MALHIMHYIHLHKSPIAANTAAFKGITPLRGPVWVTILFALATLAKIAGWLIYRDGSKVQEKRNR